MTAKNQSEYKVFRLVISCISTESKNLPATVCKSSHLVQALEKFRRKSFLSKLVLGSECF